MELAGGSSDWFRRPIGESISAGLVIGGHHEVAAIHVFDYKQPFSEKHSNDVVERRLNMKGSVFKMDP